MIDKNVEEYESINAALLFTLANLHTTVVCRVEEITGKTLSCKPVTTRVVNGESVELPLFIEVPPVFMHGGSSYIAMPVAVGDYCLLMITERCYDAWYFGDNFVPPMEMRMHDYSDGFALCGIKNESGAVEIPDVITMIGEMYANGKWVHDGELVRTGNETVTGDREQTGAETVTGVIESKTKVIAPILQGVLTGVSGAPPNIPQPVTATEIHAGNGFTGTKTADGVTFIFVDGICTG